MNYRRSPERPELGSGLVNYRRLRVEAVDAFLAREIWSGGFIAPPPPIEIPGPYPWREGAFRLRGRKTRTTP